MATTTLGVKVDESLRERLRVAATRLGCTPHWLHKQALYAYIDAIERGQLPAEISYFDTDASDAGQEVAAPDVSPPFYEFVQDVQPQSVLRAAITSAYRRPETECLPLRIDKARNAQPKDVHALASKLVQTVRGKRKSGVVESLIQEFSLSSQEGVALMCLAEALLRIPDRATRDALIRDKIAQGDWKSHLGRSPSLFVNAATWGLVLTGRLTSTSSEGRLSAALTRVIGRGGEPLIRQGVHHAMKLMGEQFVTGQDIAGALANSRSHEKQ